MPIHVAHIVLSLDPGGTEKLVLDLARRCSQTLKTRVYCLDRAGDWATQLRANHIPVDVVGRRPGLDLRVAWRLRRLAARHEVNVLHCHQYTPFVYGALATLPRRAVRVVFTEHGRLSDAPPTGRRLVANKLLAAIPSVIAAVSAELREFMIAEGFPERIDVIHNGIDPGPASLPAARASARAVMGANDGDCVVGTAARLDPVKNLDMAIAAFAEFKTRVPNAVLAIIGEGSERSRLEASAASRDVSGAIRWLGYRDDVRLLLQGLDVYLNTSLSEGVSVTILEAMAAGMPVVATAVGGTPEVVVSGVTGLLVGTRDAHACAAALERLAVDASLRSSCGQAGRERVRAHFSVEEMVNRYMHAYGVT